VTARTANTPSLEAFAESENVRPGNRSRYDVELPADVREQLLTSNVGHASAVRWLKSLGFEWATHQGLTHWRERRGWSRG
jgi:hypothetical protein